MTADKAYRTFSALLWTLFCIRGLTQGQAHGAESEYKPGSKRADIPTKYRRRLSAAAGGGIGDRHRGGGEAVFAEFEDLNRREAGLRGGVGGMLIIDLSLKNLLKICPLKIFLSLKNLT
jgi:hypothetical protein